MKKIEYLSPSSISLWEENKNEFYCKYLADERPPKFAQTQPMAAGSAFDAYVKSYLHVALFGRDNDPKFALEAILEAQVEKHHLDWGRETGLHLFNEYKAAGCLADMMLELKRATEAPRFEFTISGAIDGEREGIKHEISGVTLLGKPDVYYVNHLGVKVILDFKVNGYCSKNGMSPLAGYVRMRSSDNKTHNMHKACQPMMHNGMMINIAKYLDQQDAKWARQLAIYAWLLDCPIGSDFLVGIDQVACKPHILASTDPMRYKPTIRFAEHRTRISPNFQWQEFNKAAELWEVVHSDHIFRNLTKAASQEWCKELDNRSRDLRGEGTEADKWFAQVTRA